jgi:hypothetical protein
MPEVHQVWIQIKSPAECPPAGQSAWGWYVVVDDTVTLTDQHGKVAEDAEGRTYTEKLEPSGTAQAVAGRLTKKLRDALRGGSPVDHAARSAIPRAGTIDAPSQIYKLDFVAYRARIRELGGPRRYFDRQNMQRGYERTPRRQHTRSSRANTNARISKLAARRRRIT